MPVPKRRKAQGFSLASLPSQAVNLLDINFVFQKSKTILLYGFAPAVVVIGMMTEPCPGSWFDLINLLE